LLPAAQARLSARKAKRVGHTDLTKAITELAGLNRRAYELLITCFEAHQGFREREIRRRGGDLSDYVEAELHHHTCMSEARHAIDKCAALLQTIKKEAP
jgi:hypothetical protein